MGNHATTYRHTNATGKVVLSNGAIFQFDNPLTVAELMLEHPQEVVVELNSNVTTTTRRPTPLPADKKLDMKKIYIMLPMKRGKPASLSSDEARKVLVGANKVLRSKSLLSNYKFLPLFVKICPAGEGQNFVVPKKEKIVIEEKKVVAEFDLVESLAEGRPEYLTRQLSGGRGTWKPSLDTIKEKKIEKQVSHWMF
ncbi:hypothetical protein ACFE04_016294 [Oxalis oulophora]